MPEPYAYDKLEDAPPQHRIVATYAVFANLTVDQIAQLTEQSVPVVERILEHPPIAEFIAAERSGVLSKRLEAVSDFDQLRSATIKKARDLVDSGVMKPNEVVSLLKLTLDHHPDGTFSKTNRVSVEGMGLLSSSSRRGLMGRAAEQGIVSAQKALEVEFQVIGTQEVAVNG